MKIRANLQMMTMKAKKYGVKLPWANLDADVADAEDEDEDDAEDESFKHGDDSLDHDTDD